MTRRTSWLLRTGGVVLAGGLVLAGVRAHGATTPIITQVTGGAPDTFADGQSETGYNISFFPATKTRIETVTYNDATGESPTFVQYTDTQRTVFPGFSQLGWSFRVRTPATPDPAWTHAKVRTPPGTSALWGDPAIISHPNLPGVVFISTLQIPTVKFPASGSVVGGVGGDCSPLGGGCIARSTDGGMSFSIVDCFSDTTDVPGIACAPGPRETLGHFYDGGTMAITQSGTTFSAFAGFIDTETSREAVWKMADVNSTAADPFVLEPTRMGSMGPVGDLASIDTHMRIRGDGASLWKLAVDANGLGGNTVSLFDLKLNLHDRNGTAVVLATDARTNHSVPFPSGVAVRTGPQYNFDIGVNENGQPELRFVYIASDGTSNFLQAGFCTMDLATCRRPFQWRAPAGATPLQFHPNIKFGHDPETNKDTWKVTYYTVLAGGTQIISADLVRPDLVPTSPTFSAAGLTQTTVSPVQVPCPDLRRNSNGEVTPGYWGDYDDMAYDACAGTFSRAFTDSTLGCVRQVDFDSTHVHVSSVEMPTEGGLTMKLTGTVFIVDHENVGSNETETVNVNETCHVSTASPVDSHIRFRECTGGEVVVEMEVVCTLQPNDVIDVSFNSRLKEGGSCDTDEVEDTDTRTVTLVGQGASMPVNFNLEHGCLNCGDFAEIRLTATNAQRACLTP